MVTPPDGAWLGLLAVALAAVRLILLVKVPDMSPRVSTAVLLGTVLAFFSIARLVLA
jgi:hypothetical protein